MKYVLKCNNTYITGSSNRKVDYRFYKTFNCTDHIASFAFGYCLRENA